MTVGIYPGSFNPWHKGHEDVLKKALQVFDQVLIVEGTNPEKQTTYFHLPDEIKETYGDRVIVGGFSNLLVDAIESFSHQYNIVAVIRGLRNGSDLQYEMNQQYWNEDLGLKIPVVYFITDRSLSHISSSAIRGIERVKNTSNSKS